MTQVIANKYLTKCKEIGEGLIHTECVGNESIMMVIAYHNQPDTNWCKIAVIREGVVNVQRVVKPSNKVLMKYIELRMVNFEAQTSRD
jgi:hypothetical protein